MGKPTSLSVSCSTAAAWAGKTVGPALIRYTPPNSAGARTCLQANWGHMPISAPIKSGFWGWVCCSRPPREVICALRGLCAAGSSHPHDEAEAESF